MERLIFTSLWQLWAWLLEDQATKSFTGHLNYTTSMETEPFLDMRQQKWLWCAKLQFKNTIDRNILSTGRSRTITFKFLGDLSNERRVQSNESWRHIWADISNSWQKQGRRINRRRVCCRSKKFKTNNGYLEQPIIIINTLQAAILKITYHM